MQQYDCKSQNDITPTSSAPKENSLVPQLHFTIVEIVDAMRDADDSQADSNQVALPEGLRLSRTWLTVCLVAVTLVPISLATTLWVAVPSSPEPTLPAQVTLQAITWPPPEKGSEEVKFLPGVTVFNPTDETWKNISLAINDQYNFYYPNELRGNSQFSIPLAFFQTSGEKMYRPGLRPIKELTVYAQLPSGKRAILDIKNPAMGAVGERNPTSTTKPLDDGAPPGEVSKP